MADLAGPQKRTKKSRKKPENPEKTLEIPEDSARDPRRTENCHKNAVLCHLSQKMTQKKEVSFRRLPKNPEDWIQTPNVINSVYLDVFDVV